MNSPTSERTQPHIRSRSRRQAGYSIAEVLTATAIVSIVSGTAVPHLVSLSAHYQLTSAAHQVAFDVGRARMKAVGENVHTRVHFANEESGSSYWIERSEDGVAYAMNGGPTRLPDQVCFTSVPELLPQFDRQGLGTGTSVIGLGNSRGQAKVVRVSVLGRVTVE